MFENPRRGRQPRNFTANVSKILGLKWSSEQIFSENCRWVPLFKVSDKLQIQFVNFSNYEINRKNICHEWTYKHEPFYYWEAKMNHRWQLTCKGNWTWLLALTRKHDSTSFFESLWQFYELPMQIQLLLGSNILFVLYFLESLNW